ncbi:MAG: PLD nuclease N-terminal domain-containing protein [Nocardioides sp.]
MSSRPPKKRWSDLTPTQRRAIVLGGAAEAVLTAVALRDLARRPAAAVRGPRAAWAASFVVQPFGPLAYLVAGRR